MIVGFVTMGGLFIFAIVMVAVDVYTRKQEYTNEVNEDLRLMREKLGFDENEIRELKAKFLKYESLDADALREQEEKEAMAAMN